MFSKIKTPCYLIDEKKLINNLEILKKLQDETNCKVLLAQKAFSMFSLYPLISKYLSGTSSSGLYEAKLAHETFQGENHIFCVAYKDDEFTEIADISDHIVFNSLNQISKFRSRCSGKNSIGLRVNPQISTQKNSLYDPCAKYSRLGVKRSDLKEFSDIDGIHFHTLCEQNSNDLEATLKVLRKDFYDYLKKCKWINFGGGHHITRKDYDLELLKKCILDMSREFSAQIYIEPGEAIALNSGYLITEILDIVKNDINIAILDASAACHMPDVLEMPYRPPLKNSGVAHEKKYTYRLASRTCLAGDVVGDYSFDSELKIGDKLIFEDMAIYTMVKNNTFNGMPLPQIAVLHTNNEIEVIKTFNYHDFKERLS